MCSESFGSTGTPERGGINLPFIHAFLSHMTSHYDILGMDMTEVNFGTGEESLEKDQRHFLDIMEGVIGGVARKTDLL